MKMEEIHIDICACWNKKISGNKNLKRNAKYLYLLAAFLLLGLAIFIYIFVISGFGLKDHLREFERIYIDCVDPIIQPVETSYEAVMAIDEDSLSQGISNLDSIIDQLERDYHFMDTTDLQNTMHKYVLRLHDLLSFYQIVSTTPVEQIPSETLYEMDSCFQLILGDLVKMKGGYAW